jgi:hypothetical protein
MRGRTLVAAVPHFATVPGCKCVGRDERMNKHETCRLGAMHAHGSCRNSTRARIVSPDSATTVAVACFYGVNSPVFQHRIAQVDVKSTSHCERVSADLVLERNFKSVGS